MTEDTAKNARSLISFTSDLKEAAKAVGLTQVMTAISIFYLIIAMGAILLLKETRAPL